MPHVGQANAELDNAPSQSAPVKYVKRRSRMERAPWLASMPRRGLDHRLGHVRNLEEMPVEALRAEHDGVERRNDRLDGDEFQPLRFELEVHENEGDETGLRERQQVKGRARPVRREREKQLTLTGGF